MNKHVAEAESRQRAIEALELGCSLKVVNHLDETEYAAFECRVDFGIARSLVATGIAEWDNHPQGGTNFRRIIANRSYESGG